jgi:hypothetical protein
MSQTGGTELAFGVAGVAGLTMVASGAFALRRPVRARPVEETPQPAEELAAA